MIDIQNELTIHDVMQALNVITKGRMIMDWNEISKGSNPFVVTKTSNIPGKSVIEIPGLVFGDMNAPVKKIGVAMTMTECGIELASGMGLDLLVVHHPVADAANSGGVPFAQYLPLYNLSVIELHEAFHGLHPGLAYLHGHQKLKTDTSFGGIHGNVLHKGLAMEEIQTAGDILKRLDRYIGRPIESALLKSEQDIRSTNFLEEATLANPAEILNGNQDTPVKHILHFFPHSGFTVEHLHQALDLYPETDTIIASISRVRENHPLVMEAKRLGLTFIIGNPHSVEILENGLPLAYALEYLLPEIEIYVLRERVTAMPLAHAGHPEIQNYGKDMALNYLVSKEPIKI
ncbi:Nif3-like dinuclear metal center hexameric protein [Neobacillus soli]|uniref:Nif3-like dinuclear metal center hexameric protein n=1 Tax=Neobacillus soli TaxID=220688 RepID=UPI000824DD3E|nr:Nif3-like dinuclear metal center hexameric protein [Neobacillus soli]